MLNADERITQLRSVTFQEFLKDSKLRKMLRKTLQSLGLNPEMAESKEKPYSGTLTERDGEDSNGVEDSINKIAEISYDVPERLFQVSEKYTVPANSEVTVLYVPSRHI